MPEEKTIHDLPIAEQTNASDVFETEIPSQLMQSGYASRKVTMSSLETHMLGTEQYETQLPNFPQGSRSIFSALEYARQSGGGGGASANEALPYDEDENYVIGNYCIENNYLWRCIADTTGTFDATKWIAVLVTDEYKRVRVMHKADFDLLTPEEKADGMIFVDDVDITADDISYSAGVSVADMLTPKAVTTVAAGSAVATGSYILACYRVGKIVQVYIVGSANTAFVNTSEIMTGLPKPKDTTIRYPITKTSAGSTYVFGTSYQVSIDANGVMKPTYIPNGAIASGDYWFISFSYIAE